MTAWPGLLTLPHDPVAVPRTGEARMVKHLLWVFAMSFALDYRASSQSGGAGIDQLLFLALCGGSTLAIGWLGRRFLTVRPGAWFIGFWGLFLGWMLVNSLAQGVPPGRTLRVALPLVFCFFGMCNVHIASCMGIRPAQIVAPVLAAACTNVMWRIFHGFVIKGASISTVRLEVQSPANGWIAAWIGCAVLLRGRFHWSTIAACTVLFTGVIVTVTRSLVFPVAASAMACVFCFALGVAWKLYDWPDMARRLVPVAAVGLFLMLALGITALVQPVVIERWEDRLFHNADTQNLSADISFLTRKAEASAIWTILNEDPVHFAHGRGVGTSYYWDHAYLPEIQKVLPKDEIATEDIWFAGHSVWTYGLLSTGVIGVAVYLTLFFGVMAFSLHSARANISNPGPDQWLAFLPFVATCCLLSETLTSNPFQERLTGILFGMMVTLPQSFMVRSSWIHTRSAPANPA